jgi:hypothetical protein
MLHQSQLLDTPPTALQQYMAVHVERSEAAAFTSVIGMRRNRAAFKVSSVSVVHVVVRCHRLNFINFRVEGST